MTATDTAAEITGITDQQLTALQAGGWDDDSVEGPPIWKRVMEPEDGEQMVQWVRWDPTTWASIWSAAMDAPPSGPSQNADFGGELHLWSNFDVMLAGCDEKARGLKPVTQGEATKQEDSFAQLLAAS